MTDLNQPVQIALNITKLDLLKFTIPTVISFIVGILITPIITHFLFKFKIWKKKSVQTAVDGKAAPITAKLHNDEERKVPRMGGLVIIASVVITSLSIWVFARYSSNPDLARLDFISRSQTWLPLFGLLFGSAIGFLDDLIVCGKLPAKLSTYLGSGLSLKFRILLVSFMGLAGGWWVGVKQASSSIHIPFAGNYNIPVAVFILLFMVVVAATYAGNIIDGVDGLSAGVFSSIFTAFGLIAITQSKFDIAALCFTIVGALFAFLWFNIPPARFFMTETGSMGITILIAILAFATDTVAVLPIIAGPLVITVVSVILQLLSKKFRGKKIFIIAPYHNHLQMKGWPNYKVTMRYWVISVMFATSGVALYLLGGHFR